MDQICVPNRLIEALNRPKPPSEIWQPACDYFRGHCERIADPTNPTNISDFADYFLDYQYTEVQENLFFYALPQALEAWTRQVLNAPAPERFTGEWHFEGMWDALAGRPVHPEFLSNTQFQAMSDFLAAVLLQRMQREHSLSFHGSDASAYKWIELHATLIWLYPVADQVWRHWWTFSSPAYAICAVQWLSSFIYDANDDPYFDAWNWRDGGGPASVIETLFTRKISAPNQNIEVLSNSLTVENTMDALSRAAEVLSDHPRADQIHATRQDLSQRADVFQGRVGKLLSVLKSSKPVGVFRWEDIQPTSL